MTRSLSRRRVLRAGGAAAVAASAGLIGSQAFSQSARKLTFAWNAAAFCLSPVVVAQERGYFERNGLQVDLINYTGSTDQLLESLATAKADAAVGMIHRWLKPLEAGFDVKIVGSSHGGCEYPADLLDIAVKKGEIQAIADGDPNVYLIEKRNPGVFVEVASNLTGEYKDKVCCIVGARGELVRKDKASVAALVRAIAQASDYVAENPNESAKLFAKYSPNVQVEDLRALLGTLTHNHHPLGRNLRDEVAFYARDFQSVGVLKKSTDPQRFADHVAFDPLA